VCSSDLAKDPVSPTATKAKKVNVEDFEAAFKNIFPEKKS
jgi:hypothetical protein